MDVGNVPGGYWIEPLGNILMEWYEEVEKPV
jgi:hypothetical protein